MKSILILTAAMFVSDHAHADKIIWSCTHGGNPNALTISTIFPQTGSASLIGHVNDQEILSALGIHHLEAYDIAPLDVGPNSDLDLIYGGNVAGFEFLHVNGGIRINAGWTDTYGRHVDPPRNWFFPNGECVYH